MDSGVAALPAAGKKERNGARYVRADLRLLGDRDMQVVLITTASARQGWTCENPGSVEIGRSPLTSRAVAATAGSGIRIGGTA